MKLATFIHPATGERRVGVVLFIDEIECLVDIKTAASHFEHAFSPMGVESARTLPSDMIQFLKEGESALELAKASVRHAVEAQVTNAIHRREDVTLLPPIPRPPKIVAIGANYQDHILEGRATGALDRPLPAYPPAFLKMASAVVGPDEPIPYPSLGDELDYEVELTIVIGKSCKDVAAENWLDVVAGYTIVNDLSLRDVIMQEKETGLVFVGKNFPGSCPMGPYIVTKDEIKNPDDLRLQLRVNGITRQDGRTSNMIHRCATVVSYWSRLGLEPGDVITTGTPGGGAGFGRRFPDRLLKIGDVIEAEIEGIGVLRNAVVAVSPTVDESAIRTLQAETTY